MDFSKWDKSRVVDVTTAGAAFIYLSGYLTALVHVDAIPEGTEIGMVRITEGTTTYFFCVDVKDRRAITNFPLIRAEHIHPDDGGLSHFAEAAPVKGKKPRTDVN